MKKPLLPLFRLVVILLCLLQADLSAQALGWVKQLGGIAEDDVSDMEVDKDGNIFITGTFDYIADFDPGPNEFLLTSKGLSDVFIAKYDSLGNFIWANQFGSKDQDESLEIAVDLQGAPYLLCRSQHGGKGIFYTTSQIFDYSATPFFTYYWHLVLQLSSSGQVDQIQVCNFPIWGLVVDSQGSKYFKADLQDRFEKNTILSSGISTSINTTLFGEYLMKVNNLNKVDWFVRIGSGESSSSVAPFEKDPVIVDPVGNAYVWSSFRDVLELTVKDTVITVIAVAYSDQLISCIDSTGKISWVKQFTGGAAPRAFALDSMGQILLCADYDKRVIFNPSTSKEFLLPIGSSTSGFYLAKMSRFGELLLLKNIDTKLVPNASNITSAITFGSDYLLLAESLSTNCFFRLFTPDFELVRSFKLPFSNIFTSASFNRKQFVHHNNNKVLVSSMFSKKQDFDPSCKEYNISSFINSTDIFLLSINLDQIDSTVYKISGQKKICFGDSLLLSFPPNLKYAWSTGENNNAITVKPNKVGVSKYSVTVENAVGCIFKDSVSITVLAAPQLVDGGDQSICLGQSTPLLATGATSYAWSTGQTDSSIVVQPLVSTTYTLTLTNANGCSTVDTIQVKVNPLPVANAGADQSICMGDSAVLEASGGTQYYWNNLKLLAKQVVKPTATTSYSVVVTDGNGCAATDEVVVNVYPNPDVDLLGIDTLKLKVGQFVILYAGKGQKFLWNTGDTANTIIIDQKSGSYCVTVTSAFGCQGSDCLFVQFTPTANQEVGATTVNIYPNPAQEFLKIAVQNSAVLPYDLQLFNALGQSVKQANHNAVDQQNIDISDLPAGNYFVHLRFEGYTVVEQVVVRR